MVLFAWIRTQSLTLTHTLRRRIDSGRAYAYANRAYLLAKGRLLGGRLLFWLFAIAVGLAAVLFANLTESLAHLFMRNAKQYPWLPFVLTPTAGVAILWITRSYFQGAEGSGIPQVVAELNRPRGIAWRPLVSLRIACGKVFLGVAAIGAGFSLGREGPTVQVGASLMAAAGRYLPTTLRIGHHHLLVAGGAAGLAAAFNTPLAGIVFAIEELSRNIESKMSGLVITAIVLAGVVAQMWMGNASYFGKVVLSGETTELARTIALCAVVTGLSGGLFSRMLLISVLGWNGRLANFRRRRPYHFAALCGLLVAAIGWASGGLTWCSGYTETRILLEGGTQPWYFGPAKFVATLLAYLSGLPGGIFAPSLSIGAGIGQDLVGLLAGQADQPTVIVLCMVGFLAAATQAPLTAFIIVMEMVNGYSGVFGLMATALISSAVSRMVSRPLYATLGQHMIAQQTAQNAAVERPVAASG